MKEFKKELIGILIIGGIIMTAAFFNNDMIIFYSALATVSGLVLVMKVSSI